VKRPERGEEKIRFISLTEKKVEQCYQQGGGETVRSGQKKTWVGKTADKYNEKNEWEKEKKFYFVSSKKLVAS